MLAIFLFLYGAQFVGHETDFAKAKIKCHLDQTDAAASIFLTPACLPSSPSCFSAEWSDTSCLAGVLAAVLSISNISDAAIMYCFAMAATFWDSVVFVAIVFGFSRRVDSQWAASQSLCNVA